MKFNTKNIELLAKGEIALKNDGTLEQLHDILKESGDKDADELDGRFKFYWIRNREINCSDTACLKYLSVSEFFESEWAPQFGELVEVSDNGADWQKEFFVCKINNGFTIVAEDIDELDKPSEAVISLWKHVRQIQKETIISIEEAEKLLNVKIERS